MSDMTKEEYTITFTLPDYLDDDKKSAIAQEAIDQVAYVIKTGARKHAPFTQATITTPSGVSVTK